MSQNKRADMPTVAAFIDDLRAAFGAEGINASIKRGLRPDCKPEERFFAQENGHTLGQRYEPDPAKVVNAGQMVLTTAAEVAKGIGKGRG